AAGSYRKPTGHWSHINAVGRRLAGTRLARAAQARGELLLRPVEQHPDRKVRRNILETVRYLRSAKQDVAWAYRRNRVLDPVPSGAGGNKIQFVALVRNLRAVRGACSEPHLEIAVDKHLGRPPGRSRQGEGGGQRYGGRGAVHESSLLSGAQLVPVLNGIASRRSSLI